MLKDLRVNNVAAPLALDEAPVFSWRMDCARTGARQTAYRVVVSAEEKALWDSGRVESADSLGIACPVRLEKESDYEWSVTAWDETGAEHTAESSFGTGLMGEDLEAWHGAEWIGPDEMYLAAETIPVFRLEYAIQIEEDGRKAGVIFGANDPRLLSSTKNNYLIHGENYMSCVLNVGQIPATVEFNRKGYAPGEEGEVCFAVIEVPETVISKENRFQMHQFELICSGNQLDRILLDGTALETDEENARLVRRPMNMEPEHTHLVLNPLKKIIDVPIYPRLNEVGFVTDEASTARFSGYSIRHYAHEHAEIFGASTGATFKIFSGKPGLTIEEGVITAAPGTLTYADPSYASVPMLRKEFTLEKPIASARLYAAAWGIYEIAINGQKAGDDYLAPGDMDFRQHVVYETYDVTDLLKEGANAIGATVASGWYGDQSSYTIENYNWYGDRQALLALLAVTYADGETVYLPTDGSWQYYGEGPVRYAGNFNGEIYDARREQEVEGWTKAGFAGAGWRPATLMGSKVFGQEPIITAKPDPYVTKVEERTAQYVGSETRGADQDTVYIYDMGINMVGVPEITLPQGKPGQKITVRYAEICYPRLKEDNPYYYGDLAGLILTENLRGALVTDKYTMKGEGTEVIHPRFTFHGYRYVEISGTDGPIPAENIKGIVLSSVRATSHYQSSNPLTNQLFDNIICSTSGNHLSIPTDCPQRDERLGWAGDAQVYSEAAVYMADMRAFYAYFDQLQREAQGSDGTFHLFAPSYNETGKAFALGYTWNAAGVVIPFRTYLQYGDLKLLKGMYPAMKSHVLGMMHWTMEGYQCLSSYIGFLGDHLSVVPTDPFLLDNAQFYRSVIFTQQAAEILGEDADAATFRTFAENLKAEWNKTFINKEGRTCKADGTLEDTQSSYALPLLCGIISDENKPMVQLHLKEACEKTDHTMTTGFMGTGPLLPALTEAGETETAYKLFEQTKYPSWLYPVVNGATSIWERWNSYTIENGFSGNNGMNSFNHYSLGAVGSWMMEYQAGIARGEKEAFKDFILQPTPGGHFDWVNASYDSIYGTIESNWKTTDGALTAYEAVVPANTTATLYLPVGEDKVKELRPMEGAEYQGMVKRFGKDTACFKLTSGRYVFTWN